jgi:hypothetical protein
LCDSIVVDQARGALEEAHLFVVDHLNTLLLRWQFEQRLDEVGFDRRTNGLISFLEVYVKVVKLKDNLR